MTINERMTTIGIANQLDWAAAELEAQLAAAQSRNNELEIICKALGSRVAAAKKMAEGAANE